MKKFFLLVGVVSVALRYHYNKGKHNKKDKESQLIGEESKYYLVEVNEEFDTKKG